jgi:hypothetical protein
MLIKVKFNKLKKKATQTAQRMFGKKNPVPFADRPKKEKKVKVTDDKGKPKVKKATKLGKGEKKICKGLKINYKALAGYQHQVEHVSFL